MDDLRALKRAVFVAIGERLKGVTVAGAAVRIRRSADALRVEAHLPDGSQGLVHLATIKAGLPVGAFAIDPSALVYGGLVRNLLEQLPVPGRHIAGLGAILSAKSPGRLSRREPIPVFTADSPAIDEVAEMVRDGFLPLLAAFAGDWPAALQHTLAHPDEVDRPYSAAVVLSLLTGGGTTVAAIDARAAADQRFWDRSLAVAVPGWRDSVGAVVAAAGAQ